MARVSGWLIVALLALAAGIVVAARVRAGKRASPRSRSAGIHVLVGLATAAIAFGHTLVGVLSLGTPGAIAAGELALAAGAVAFLILIAHTGIGLQLRDPALRKRPAKRRTHVITALSITAASLIHAVLLLAAR